ncbi:MAG: alpha/beta hydrolase fold domain-containing protein, partial [Oleiharenicola lentus]
MKLIVVAGILLASGPGLAAAEPDVLAMETRVFKQVAGRELRVDVFQPKQGRPPAGHPAIAFFHGGGWVFGRPAEFHESCRRYARMGFATFAFQYRLSINADGSYPHPDI